MKKFDRNAAIMMIEFVHENQKQGIGYRELQRRVGLENHDKKFNKLMAKLRELQIFDSPLTKERGKQIQIRLTEQKYKDYQNADSWLPPTEFTTKDVFEHTAKRHRIKDDEFLCMAIMTRAAFGTTREEQTTEPKRGDVMMQDPTNPSKKTCFTMVSKPGIGIEDITIKSIRPGPNARMLDRRNFTSLNELLSQHLKISNEKTKNTIEYLKNHEPPILKKIKYGNEDRFEIADPILCEFIKEWVVSVTAVDQSIRHRYLRGELSQSDKLEYAKWNESSYGINSKVWENYLPLRRKYYRNKRTTYDTNGDLLDRDILAHQDILLGNSDSNPSIHRFKKISKTYPIINAMLSLRYPQFIETRLKMLKDKHNIVLRHQV